MEAFFFSAQSLALFYTSASGRSNGARLVSARREMKNITNTGNKGIPDHICFCAMTISLELRGPTHISTVYRGPRPEPHVQVSLHVARLSYRAFRGAACDSAWEKGALSCLEHCPSPLQAARLYSSIPAATHDPINRNDFSAPLFLRSRTRHHLQPFPLPGTSTKLKRAASSYARHSLVALVYIPEYSYGRSVTQPTKKPKGLTPSRLENDPYGMA
ncbi:hypothetical protein Lal_00002450 [Lupinus albus]|nr:hypothetical protein Lal_00002450 [Lupinus albus]